MYRYLFTIPGVNWPVTAFGFTLFLAFVLVMWWGMRRGLAIGLPREKTQDLALTLFLTGIIGARIVYMIQYRKQFPGKTVQELLVEFVSIWNGGIVFYGSVFGGLLGFLIFNRLVLRRFKIDIWQLADVIAPLLALGLAVGRIGCYLNGCCWGQVAVPEAQPVPLGGSLGEFPLLPAYCRNDLCRPPAPDERLPQIHGLQTSLGFALGDRLDARKVTAVEPKSDADGKVNPGDKIVGVNGEENDTDSVKLSNVVEGWPDRQKGAARIDLKVESPDGKVRDVTLRPVTMPFYPTQLYETISMVLLMLLLVAFQPFRRHDGQVMVLLMVGYAVHRFLNEAIRIEPSYSIFGIDYGLTLSQWISVLILLAAVALEIYLRLTRPKLPAGAVPLGYRPRSTAPTTAPTAAPTVARTGSGTGTVDPSAPGSTLPIHGADVETVPKPPY
jgi:phosphatidylglycerol:prolipoprotein diacylglycerol transferase